VPAVPDAARLRPLAAATAAGYLLGTIPTGDLVARAASGGDADLRAAGTGNPGAVNAMAVLGKGWGYAVLALDITKGAAACAAGRRLAGDDGAHVAGTASVVGHCFPPWSGFKGGKGVAASVGQCAMTFPVYVPVDLGVAWFTATRRWRARTFAATMVSCGLWVASGTVWWRRGWPNAWGPAPTAALPLASAASSAVIISRFAATRRQVLAAIEAGETP